MAPQGGRLPPAGARWWINYSSGPEDSLLDAARCLARFPADRHRGRTGRHWRVASAADADMGPMRDGIGLILYCDEEFVLARRWIADFDLHDPP